MSLSTAITINEALDWLTRMASADGVLSASELKILRAFATKYNIEPDLAVEMARKLAAAVPKPEVAEIDYRELNGRDFENLIAAFISESPVLSLIFWTGDKYHRGVYNDSNLEPDFHIRQMVDGVAVDYYVECKWKHYWQKRGRFYFFEIPQYQLDRYRRFAADEGKIVLIAHASGRSGRNPRALYLIPLHAFEGNIVKKYTADRYYRIPVTATAFTARMEQIIRTTRR